MKKGRKPGAKLLGLTDLFFFFFDKSLTDLLYTVRRNKQVHVIDLQNGNFAKLDSRKRRKHSGNLSKKQFLYM